MVRRAFYTVLTAGLFVLMLSALVVTPDLPDAPPPMRPPSDFHAVFRPDVPAVLPAAAQTDSVRTFPRADACVPAEREWFSPVYAGTHDANGHVVTAARYENSVYQVFRAEVAGG